MSKLKAKDPKSAEPSKPKIVVFGSYGVGKTWGALSFPSCYYIDTEGGANLNEYTDRLKKSGGRYFGPEDGSCDLVEITAQMEALATEKHQFKTLIVDSITKPYLNDITREAEKLGDKDAFGASKKPAIAKLRRMLLWLDRLDMNVIFIAREKAKWHKGEQIGLEADIYEQLNYELHLVLRITRTGPSRTAQVVKTRLRGFPDADTFEWTTTNAITDSAALDEFVKRMGKGIMDAAKPVQLASAEQLAEISRLLEIVKVSETDIEKVLTKANAEKWADLTTEQATATVAWLNKKLQK